MSPLTEVETHPLNTLIASMRLAVGHITIVHGGVDGLTSAIELMHSKHYKGSVFIGALEQCSHFSYRADK